jgi:hypothetical protein
VVRGFGFLLPLVGHGGLLNQGIERLWLFFSSQVPHIIETVPLENRRQVGPANS